MVHFEDRPAVDGGSGSGGGGFGHAEIIVPCQPPLQHIFSKKFLILCSIVLDRVARAPPGQILPSEFLPP